MVPIGAGCSRKDEGVAILDYALDNRPSTERGKWAAGCFPNAPGVSWFLSSKGCGSAVPRVRQQIWDNMVAGREKTAAIAYLRTSSAANVGTDKDSDKRQRAGIEAFKGAKQGDCTCTLIWSKIHGQHLR